MGSGLFNPFPYLLHLRAGVRLQVFFRRTGRPTSAPGAKRPSAPACTVNLFYSILVVQSRGLLQCRFRAPPQCLTTGRSSSLMSFSCMFSLEPLFPPRGVCFHRQFSAGLNDSDMWRIAISSQWKKIFLRSDWVL